MADERVVALVRSVRLAWSPVTKLTVSGFADAELRVSNGPRAGTRWNTAFAEYQRGILDVFHERGIEECAVMGSSQWGKTSILVALVAYHMAHDPCPILIVEPTVDPMARDFAANRLETAIDAAPVLRRAVAGGRMKGKAKSGDRTLEKRFRGGFVAVGGANAASALASRPIRFLGLDEIDRYPRTLTGEGSTIAVAKKRTQTFGRRKRVFACSSPTVVGAPIHAWFLEGDQRRFFVPCASCGVLHKLEWKNVRWENRDPETARLVCPSCGYAMNELERRKIIRFGEWRAEHPERADRRIASFHLWEAYSPFSSLASMVAGFLKAYARKQEGDLSELQTWTNTTLGEPFEVEQRKIETDPLFARREAWFVDGVDVPAGGVCLTMAVDTQDNRLEALVVAWGVGEESWFIDHLIFPGDTSQSEPWDALGAALSRQYVHASGHRLPIMGTVVDTAGHRTREAYRFVFAHETRRVFAIIGRDGDRTIVSSPTAREWGAEGRQVPLYTVGVDAGKTLFADRLALPAPGPGFVHLPIRDWCGDPFLKQLTAEVRVQRFHHGIPFYEWKQIRPRNEGLDLAVYSIACLRLLNPRLQQMAEALATAPAAAAAASSASSAKKPAPRRAVPSKYLHG